MDDLTLKLEQYSEVIPPRKATEFFKLYYQTGDLRIREQLIYRYMPVAKREILSLGITSIDEDDLEQMAYETLICCIDKYDPFDDAPFATYLNNRINHISKKHNEKNEFQDTISLSDVEIYSNDNLEDSIIDKIIREGLIDKLKKLLDKYPTHSEKTKKIFKKIYGIDCEPMNVEDIAREENISTANIYYTRNRILLYLFLCLAETYHYQPSETIERFLTNPDSCLPYFFSKDTKNKIENFDFGEMEFLTLYSDCDNLKDSHKTLKIR